MHENDGRRGCLPILSINLAHALQFPNARPLEEEKKRCGFVRAWEGGREGGRISETTSVSVGRSRSLLSFFPSFSGRKKVEREEKAPSVGKKLAVGTAASRSCL